MAVDMDNMTDEEFSRYMDGAIASNDVGVSDDEIEVTNDSSIENTENEIAEQLTEVDDEFTDEDSDEANDEDVEPDEDDEAEDSEAKTVEPDEVADEEEEQTTADDTKSEDVQKHIVKADGTEFEFTTEELKNLAPKAINYTKKLQALAPYRKRISAMEEVGLSEEEFNLLLDVHAGNKEAITTLLKRTGVDALELSDAESAENYVPKNYGKSEAELNIQEVESNISGDAEYAITRHVVNNQWDDASRNILVKNPAMIEGLHADVKNGIFDKVLPLAIKAKVLDGAKKSDVEYYIEEGGKYLHRVQAEQAAEIIKAEKRAKEEAVIAKTKQEKAKQVNVAEKSSKRKAAATTVVKAGNSSVSKILDVDSMSDDEFSTWMDKQIKKK